MQLTMLGGGGFRTPLVYQALIGASLVDEVVLHDVDPARLAVIERVLAQLAADNPGAAPTVRSSTVLKDALAGTDVVFSAIRVGGLAGRVADEQVALDLGLLGQETTGPGGLAYGLRTVPVALRIAEQVRRSAPTAWVVNFTNPAGLITEAMRSVLGERVIGICDSPIALARRIGSVLGAGDQPVELDYAGLNHLGWLRGMRCGERDLVAEFLQDDAAIGAVEEGALFGADWLRSLGAVPNEYLYYYYFTRDAVRAIRAAEQTRGEQLLSQQQTYYAQAAADLGTAEAVRRWDAVRQERNATYLQEARTEERSAADVAGGGYEGVALALMTALTGGAASTQILNVAGAGLPGLDDQAVAEVPCRVDADGVHPLPVTPLTGAELGLVQQVKAVERLVISAAITGSTAEAVKAFALHPLVDSVHLARDLLTGYRARIPEVDAVFRR